MTHAACEPLQTARALARDCRCESRAVCRCHPSCLASSSQTSFWTRCPSTFSGKMSSGDGWRCSWTSRPLRPAEGCALQPGKHMQGLRVATAAPTRLQSTECSSLASTCPVDSRGFEHYGVPPTPPLSASDLRWAEAEPGTQRGQSEVTPAENRVQHSSLVTRLCLCSDSSTVSRHGARRRRRPFCADDSAGCRRSSRSGRARLRSAQKRWPSQRRSRCA